MNEGAAFIEQLINAIRESGITKDFAKGSLVLKEGEIEKNLYFIETGAVRVFILSEHEELNIRFGYEGSLINSLSSYIKGTPSEFYIEALRKTRLKAISKEQVERLVYKDSNSMKAYINLLELLVTQQIERETDLLTVAPAERLSRVLWRSPNVFQQIPLKHIANYLRMTPETLSRIRKS